MGCPSSLPRVANVSLTHRRADNWYNSTEVGGTTSGTAGLDLASTGPSSVNVNASAIGLSGNSITLIGETSSDEDDKDDSVIPDSWKEGSIITVEAPDSYTVASESGKTVIYGDFTELVPIVGMPVTAVWNDYSYDLFIASVSKGSPAVPGQGGNAASISANAAPTTYDFSATALSFTLTWAGASYVISLTAKYVTMQGLVDEITDQLTGSGLIATGDNTRLSIQEKNSPFSGNTIGYTVLPVAIFGNSPVVVQGIASSGGSPEVLPSLSLAYDSAKGPVFYGLPTGTQRISIGPQGNKYQITDIDGLTISVKRLTESDDGTTSIDNSWPGFTARTLLDASVTGTNDEYDWMGPFECCPDGEKTSLVEMNFVFPSGLAHINKKGHIKSTSVTLAIQYRQTGGDWVEVLKTYSQGTVDEVGFTESFSLPNQSQYEFRVRRTTTPAGGSDRDSVQWQAMRAKLSNRPNRYADVTTMAVTVRTGNRLAAQSDRRINVVATRLYDGYPSRSISGALNHLLSTTDAQIDTATINALEANYWTPRNETFDYSADSDSTSMLDILQKIATAGMGYFHLSDGLATVGREGVKNWSGVITPQETTEELTTAFKASTSDDYDGVDVTYISSLTWAEETVQCRTADNPTPNKVENYKLDGVVTADRAYRIGMRRLMKYIYQRCTYSTSTELDALCYRYGDRVVMSDDIPGSTISSLVIGMQYTDSLVTIETSERLDWTFANPRVLFRLQDGSAVGLLTPTRVDDFTFTVPNSTDLSPEQWEMDSGSIEPPRVMFCSSESAGYDTLISEISPDADGTCQVTALSYDPKFYQHDDDTYPGSIPERVLNFAFYGDSTVDGYMTSPFIQNLVDENGNAKGNHDHTKDAPNSWVSLEATVSKHNLYNCGYSGKAIIDDWAIDNIDTAIFNNSDIAPPSYIFLDFGLNDFIRNNWSVDNFKTKYREIISHIRSKGVGVVIVTSDPVSNRTDRPYDAIQNQVVQSQIDISEELSLLLFDKNKDLITLGSLKTLQPDGLHFANEGHRIKQSLLHKFLINTFI